MSKVCIFFANGFEEVEGLTVVDIVRRAGIEIDMVSVTGEICVEGAHKIKIMADKLFEDMDFNEYDMAVIPGGIPGTPNLQAHEGVISTLKEFYNENKYIGAICAAPSILGGLGFLDGKNATCYPGYENKLGTAHVKDVKAVKSDNIITGQALGGAIEFALKIVEALDGADKANKVKNAIVY